MFSEQMIAPCGLDCALCSGAHKKERPCLGCNGPDEGKADFCLNRCAIIQCPVRIEKGYRFCDQCPEYPCGEIMERETRYQSQYVLKESPVQNLRDIAQYGMKRFLASQKEKWSCPDCGGVVSVHNGVCSGCGRRMLPQSIRDPQAE